MSDPARILDAARWSLRLALTLGGPPRRRAAGRKRKTSPAAAQPFPDGCRLRVFFSAGGAWAAGRPCDAGRLGCRRSSAWFCGLDSAMPPFSALLSDLTTPPDTGGRTARAPHRDVFPRHAPRRDAPRRAPRRASVQAAAAAWHPYGRELEAIGVSLVLIARRMSVTLDAGDAEENRAAAESPVELSQTLRRRTRRAAAGT